MAEKYEIRPFEYVNNKDCRFYEASVNGKYLYQEFLLGLKDKKNDIRVYVIMRKPNVFVVLGGYKGEQNSDIKRIKKLFNDF